jgi:hypothetical protein
VPLRVLSGEISFLSVNLRDLPGQLSPVKKLLALSQMPENRMQLLSRLQEEHLNTKYTKDSKEEMKKKKVLTLRVLCALRV